MERKSVTSLKSLNSNCILYIFDHSESLIY
ncbi:MAG: hypothetical protein IAE90_00875 [Ignavibacteria bacterium]|nr:hypothetical protein [Ignavibacteria bacterium]